MVQVQEKLLVTFKVWTPSCGFCFWKPRKFCVRRALSCPTTPPWSFPVLLFLTEALSYAVAKDVWAKKNEVYVYPFVPKYVIKIIRSCIYIGKIYHKDTWILWITAIFLLMPLEVWDIGLVCTKKLNQLAEIVPVLLQTPCHKTQKDENIWKIKQIQKILNSGRGKLTTNCSEI